MRSSRSAAHKKGLSPNDTPQEQQEEEGGSSKSGKKKGRKEEAPLHCPEPDLRFDPPTDCFMFSSSSSASPSPGDELNI